MRTLATCLCAALAVTLAAPAGAAACSPPSCWRWFEVWPTRADAQLPENGAAVFISTRTVPFATSCGAVEITATRARGGVEEQFTLASGALPGARAGDRWTIRVSQDGGRGAQASVVITEPTPEPTRLGTLVLGPLTRGGTPLDVSDGSCFRDVDSAYVDLSVAFDPSMAIWSDGARLEVEVDGQIWTDWRAAEKYFWVSFGAARLQSPRVFAVCEPRGARGTTIAGLSEGPHSVRLVARHPGLEGEWATDARTVVLTCGAADSGAGDADAGSIPAEDAAGVDAATIDGDTREAPAAGHCSVRLGPPPAGAPLALLALGATWLCRSRRRARECADLARRSADTPGEQELFRVVRFPRVSEWPRFGVGRRTRRAPVQSLLCGGHDLQSRRRAPRSSWCRRTRRPPSSAALSTNGAAGVLRLAVLE